MHHELYIAACGSQYWFIKILKVTDIIEAAFVNEFCHNFNITVSY